MVSENEVSAVPRAEYSRRMAELSVERSNLQRQERLVGYIQLGLGAFCLAWILFRVRHFTRTDLLVLIPITAFVVLAVLHGRLQRAVSARTRAIRFYEQGLARLNGTWAGSGATGERFLQPSDPCARDLDLFGRASLFRIAVHGTYPCRGGSAGAMADGACAAGRGPRPASGSDRAKPSPAVSRKPLYHGRRRGNRSSPGTAGRLGRRPAQVSPQG